MIVKHAWLKKQGSVTMVFIFLNKLFFFFARELKNTFFIASSLLLLNAFMYVWSYLLNNSLSASFERLYIKYSILTLHWWQHLICWCEWHNEWFEYFFLLSSKWRVFFSHFIFLYMLYNNISQGKTYDRNYLKKYKNCVPMQLI